MAMTTIGLDGLIEDMAALAALPDKVIDDMLNAKADVIEPAQKQQAEAMGVQNTGMVISSIKRGKSKRTNDGRTLAIYPRGKRNAEVAFLNEFGTKGNRRVKGGKRFVRALGASTANLGKMPARPFIDAANKAAGQRATDAAAKVYDEFLKSKNL